MSSQGTVHRIHKILNIVERVTKIDVTSEEGRASAMAILASEHQHNTHPLLVKIMEVLSVPPDPDLYHRLSDDRVGLHTLIRLEEEFGEDDAEKAVNECRVSLSCQMI